MPRIPLGAVTQASARLNGETVKCWSKEIQIPKGIQASDNLRATVMMVAVSGEAALFDFSSGLKHIWRPKQQQAKSPRKALKSTKQLL